MDTVLLPGFSLQFLFFFHFWVTFFVFPPEQLYFNGKSIFDKGAWVLHSMSACIPRVSARHFYAQKTILLVIKCWGRACSQNSAALSCRRLPSSILAEKSTVGLTSSPDEAASRLLRCHGILRFSIWPVTSLRQFSLINILYRFVLEQGVALFLKIFKKSLIYLFK